LGGAAVELDLPDIGSIIYPSITRVKDFREKDLIRAAENRLSDKCFAFTDIRHKICGFQTPMLE
jgi:2C-methyl-D-erythritol 2,4-cyclodiphosphate synthase